MRFFTASLWTETNTFAPLPTARDAFECLNLGTVTGPTGMATEIAATMRFVVEEGGDECVAGPCIVATPAGRTLDAVYNEWRDSIVSSLRAAGRVDAILLLLHGAMAAFNTDDCEGDLLAALRAEVGPDVPIGAVLDPHAHLTNTMLEHADVLVFMKLYPHTDGLDRGRELADLLRRAARREIVPVMAVFDPKMIGFYPTTEEPMSGFVSRMQETEGQPGILSVSFIHGFPWGDVAEVGSRLLVVTDGDAQLAIATASQLGMEIYEFREALRPRFVDVDSAMSMITASGLTVFADIADNAGGGAASDNTAILRVLLDRPIGPAAIGIFWDPVAVDLCFRAGVGSTFDLRIGGKAGRSSGTPVDVRATVTALADELTQEYFAGEDPLGRSALVTVGDLDILLSTIRTQTYSTTAFTNIGVDLASKRLVVVKSTQHFQASFEPIAERIIQVNGGGALDMDFAHLPYTKRDALYWPRVADPLACA